MQTKRLAEITSSIAYPVSGTETERPKTAIEERQRRRFGVRASSIARAVSIEHKFLIVLLFIFGAKAVAIGLIHQPFTGHDEVAHYAYLEIVATKHRVPVVPDLEKFAAAYKAGKNPTFDEIPAKLWQYGQYVTRDWDFYGNPACADPCYLKNAPEANGSGYITSPNGWVYTANHPPLFYLYMTPFYWLTEGQSPASQLYVFRMATIPFGLLTVLFAFLSVRTLFPRDRFLQMTVPAFVAFQPQISYESAMLNNDILAICFTSAVIYLLVLGLKKRFPVWNVLAIGAAYGIAALSKSTSLTAGFLIAFAMILGIGITHWREWIAKGALSGFVAALLIWPWYLFLWHTYGNLTVLPQIKALQWWNYQGVKPPTLWGQLDNKRFFWGRWQETWGDFGWRLIPLTDDLLKAILFPILLATIGLAIYAWRFWQVQRPILRADTPEEAAQLAAGKDGTLAIESWQVIALLMMGLTCVMAYAAVLQFGVSFALTQARYYFPAIDAAAVLVMLGVRSWFPRKWLPYVAVVVFLALFGLNLVIYSEYVVPWNTTGQYARDSGF